MPAAEGRSRRAEAKGEHTPQPPGRVVVDIRQAAAVWGAAALVACIPAGCVPAAAGTLPARVPHVRLDRAGVAEAATRGDWGRSPLAPRTSRPLPAHRHAPAWGWSMPVWDRAVPAVSSVRELTFVPAVSNVRGLRLVPSGRLPERGPRPVPVEAGEGRTRNSPTSKIAPRRDRRRARETSVRAALRAGRVSRGPARTAAAARDRGPKGGRRARDRTVEGCSVRSPIVSGRTNVPRRGPRSAPV